MFVDVSRICKQGAGIPVERGKSTPSSHDRDSNLDFPVLSSIVQHETTTFVNYANDAVDPFALSRSHVNVRNYRAVLPTLHCGFSGGGGSFLLAERGLSEGNGEREPSNS
uniref:Uncharacterized protein n=1 Tax=Timema poppense TaxID=170557 RepID=A0A7R9DAV9_TIMPO|nr:unnamed protein product [Timema poppensis]